MALALEEKVNSLESILGHFMVSTDMALTRMERGILDLKREMKDFKDEMKDFKNEMKGFKDGVETFKDEMKDFKDEMKDFKNEMKGFKDGVETFKDEMKGFRERSESDRREMNRKWGDLANKMGTLVEDIVAPNMLGVIREYFHVEEPDFFAVRVRKTSSVDRSLRREFDVIAVSDAYLFINETKSNTRLDYINSFIELLPQLPSFFPEYRDRKIVLIFASLYIPAEIVACLTRHGIYAMGMKDDTMDLLNFEEIG